MTTKIMSPKGTGQWLTVGQLMLISPTHNALLHTQMGGEISVRYTAPGWLCQSKTLCCRCVLAHGVSRFRGQARAPAKQ